MNKYTVNSPLDHDCCPYPIGATVEMSEEQAAHLVELGRVSLDARKTEPGAPGGPEASEEPGASEEAGPAEAVEMVAKPSAKSAAKGGAKTVKA